MVSARLARTKGRSVRTGTGETDGRGISPWNLLLRNGERTAPSPGFVSLGPNRGQVRHPPIMSITSYVVICPIHGAMADWTQEDVRAEWG